MRAPEHRTSDRVTAALIALSVLWTVWGAVIRDSRTSPSGPPELHVVTALPGRESDPAVAPGGRRVAFVWSGRQGDSPDLYLKDLTAESMTRLTDDPALELSPAWAPDGERIAFARVDHESCGIIVLDLLQMRERPITDCATGGHPQIAWSPLGDVLALSDSDGSGGRSVISVVRVDGGDRRRVTDVVEGYGDRWPAFSPDGREIAFVRTLNMGRSDVWVLPLNGRPLRQITTGGHAIQGLTWTGAGSIVLSARRSGDFSLWAVSPFGGPLRWIGLEGARSVEPAGVGGETLIFEQQKFESDLWQIEPRSGRPAQRLVDWTTWEEQPRFSPDGMRIAFVSRRSGHPEVWISDGDGRGSRRLTELRAAAITSPRWSPDGTKIAFAADVRRSSTIRVVDVATGAVEHLSSGLGNELAPAWSADGSSIYFVSGGGGAWRIWCMNISDRTRRAIADVPAGSIFATSDARTIYFSRMDRPGIWRAAVESGHAERVVDRFHPGDWANWELTGDRLYYLDRRPAAFITFLDLESGVRTPLAAVAISPDDYGLSVDPAGTRIVFARGERLESDLVVVGPRGSGAERGLQLRSLDATGRPDPSVPVRQTEGRARQASAGSAPRSARSN